jgi:hypothetical protein
MAGSLQPPKQVGVIRSVEVEVEGALDKLRAGRKEATARVKDLTKKVDADTAALAKYTSECRLGGLLEGALGGLKGHWVVQRAGRIRSMCAADVPWHAFPDCLLISTPPPCLRAAYRRHGCGGASGGAGGQPG